MAERPSSRPSYQEEQGALLKTIRNNTKVPPNIVRERTGIDTDRLHMIESGQGDPVTMEEVRLLSEVYGKDLRTFFPATDDTGDTGVRIQPFATALTRDEFRGSDQRLYTYKHLAASTLIPDVDAVYLDLHQTDKDVAAAQMNHGHMEAQLTVVAPGSGPVGVIGKHRGETYFRILESVGDSVEILSGTPHGFWSPDPENLGSIVAVTHAHHINYEVREQLRQMGVEAVMQELGRRSPVETDFERGMKFQEVAHARRERIVGYDRTSLAQSRNYPHFRPALYTPALSNHSDLRRSNLQHKWGIAFSPEGQHSSVLRINHRSSQTSTPLQGMDSFVLHGAAEYALEGSDATNSIHQPALIVDLPGAGGRLESDEVLAELKLIAQEVGPDAIGRFLKDGDYNRAYKK